MVPPGGTFRSQSSIVQRVDPDRKRRRNLHLSGHPEALRLAPLPTPPCWPLHRCRTEHVGSCCQKQDTHSPHGWETTVNRETRVAWRRKTRRIWRNCRRIWDVVKDKKIQNRFNLLKLGEHQVYFCLWGVLSMSNSTKKRNFDPKMKLSCLFSNPHGAFSALWTLQTVVLKRALEIHHMTLVFE